jgi:site-specific DNA-methyltransferase (adenine-specific)
MNDQNTLFQSNEAQIPQLRVTQVSTCPSMVFNEDCMIGMKRYPNKYFDLAVVDPPYGIGRDFQTSTVCKNPKHNRKKFDKKGWDNAIPTLEYFDELFRVSKNQIIWGANYFTEYLPKSMGWIFWDKGQDLTMSDGELAFTSFDKALRRKTINRMELAKEGTIHPTQKPIKLYDWIYSHYLPLGGKVIDTHLGSGSNRIAANRAGNVEFVGFEIDSEYFSAQELRYKNFVSQQRLF